MKSISMAVGGFALAISGAPAMAATSYTGHELAPLTHVSMTKAQAIALKVRPGRLTARELEKEGGGSGLRYSFDIRSGGKMFEVGVDAATGAILENKAEGPHPD